MSETRWLSQLLARASAASLSLCSLSLLSHQRFRHRHTPIMTADSALFEPIRVGDMELQHRLVMAPLTRFRADLDHVHQPVAAEYYSQRASTPGTLLITEATFVAEGGKGGYANVPGCRTDAQVAGWKRVVDAVHAKGCKIVLQLWALGRAADADNLRDETGQEVVSASDIPFEGGATPRPLTAEEIKVRALRRVVCLRGLTSLGPAGVRRVLRERRKEVRRGRGR